MIWSLPQLQEFLGIVNKSPNLDRVVWAVLGGIPADYEKIWGKFKRLRLVKDSMDAKQLIGELLCDEISSAIKIVRDAKDKSNMTKIIELFDKEMNGIVREHLTVNKLIRPTPDKVFHEVKRHGIATLVPTSNAIGIVLRYNLTKEPTLETVEKIVLSTFEIQKN